jgi:hypothetical protein
MKRQCRKNPVSWGSREYDRYASRSLSVDVIRLQIPKHKGEAQDRIILTTSVFFKTNDLGKKNPPPKTLICPSPKACVHIGTLFPFPGRVTSSVSPAYFIRSMNTAKLWEPAGLSLMSVHPSLDNSLLALLLRSPPIHLINEFVSKTRPFESSNCCFL